jgi:hypothetical protein
VEVSWWGPNLWKNHQMGVNSISEKSPTKPEISGTHIISQWKILKKPKWDTYIYIISNQLLFSLIENGIYLPVLEHGPEIPKCSVVKVAISMDFFTFGDLSF